MANELTSEIEVSILNVNVERKEKMFVAERVVGSKVQMREEKISRQCVKETKLRLKNFVGSVTGLNFFFFTKTNSVFGWTVNKKNKREVKQG